jgi:hypothetical protein
MMKATIALGAALLLASSAFAEVKQDSGPIVIQGGALDCTGAASLTCGDVGNGQIGLGGAVGTYGCTTLTYGLCGESVYEICVGATDNLTVTVTYAHNGTNNDLDAFLLGSCNEADCLDSSTGTSGTETLGPQAVTAGTYSVVVDGWNSSGGIGRCADGTHTVSVSCSSPCTPVSVEPTTWGSVKGLYSN